MPAFVLPFAIPVAVKTAALVVSSLSAAGLITKGAYDTYKAFDTFKGAKNRNSFNQLKFELTAKFAASKINELSEMRQRIFEGFARFSEAFGKIHDAPEEFGRLAKLERLPNSECPNVSFDSLTKGTWIGIGASSIFGSGTSLAASKFLMASGPATLGAGFVVGGVAFAYTGSKLRIKADEAYDAAIRNESEINKSLQIYGEITKSVNEVERFTNMLKRIYVSHVDRLYEIVGGCTDFFKYSPEEQEHVEATVMVAAALHRLISAPLLKVVNERTRETVLDGESVERAMREAKAFLAERDWG